MGFTLDSLVGNARRIALGAPLLAGSAACVCVLILFAGCSTEAVPRGSQFVVSAPTAQFYKNGPAQDVNLPPHTFDLTQFEGKTGPDFELPKGARVTLLKREFGYSRVITDDGVTGYVANEQLRPAPALARAVPVETRNGSSFRQPTRNTQPSHPREEQLDLNDLPLPLPG